MARSGLILMAIVLLCVWTGGCMKDDPTAPPTQTIKIGTVVVNPSPDSLAGPWQLTGPSSYSYDGTGNETLSSLTPGDYTLTWTAVTGWDLPSLASDLLPYGR